MWPLFVFWPWPSSQPWDIIRHAQDLNFRFFQTITLSLINMSVPVEGERSYKNCNIRLSIYCFASQSKRQQLTPVIVKGLQLFLASNRPSVQVWLFQAWKQVSPSGCHTFTRGRHHITHVARNEKLSLDMHHY